MDYTKLNETIYTKVMGALALINNPEIDPQIRQRNQEILLREVGESVYKKIYDMNAFDYELDNTRGPGLDDRYYGLAKVASDSVSTGDKALDQHVRTYLDGVTAKAQYDATTNANQSGKRTKVIRTVTNETCAWCDARAGTFTDPDPEVFRRHRGCDCRIVTEGYKSRNGLLDNYVKSDKNKTVIESGGLRTEDAAQKAMENALNAGNVAKAQQIVDGVQDQDLKAGLQSTIDSLQGKKKNIRVDPVTKKIIVG